MWRAINFRCFLLTATCLIVTILFLSLAPKTISVIFVSLFCAVLFALAVVSVLNRKIVYAVGLFLSVVLSVCCIFAVLNVEKNWVNELEENVEYNFTATVVSIADKGSRYYLTADDVMCDGKGIEGKIGLYVEADDTEYNLRSGDRIYFKSSVYFVKLFGNSLNGYAYRNNIRYGANVNKSEILLIDSKPNFFQSLRNRLQDILNDNLGAYSATAFAMLTGEKGGIGETVINYYSVSGLGHILAVSGLHVGFVVLLFSWILNKLHANKIVKLSVISAVLLFYCFLASFAPSVVRASIMCVIGLLADVFGKQKDPFNSLCCAVTVILSVKPFYLFDAGFLMSVSAVLGILFFAKSFLKIFTKFLPNWLAQAISASLAAQIGITPIMLITYHSFPAYSIIVNCLVLPLVTVTFIALTVSAVICLIFPFAGILTGISGLGLALIDTVAELVSMLPLADIRIFAAAWFAVVFILYFICSKFFMLPKFKRIVSAVSVAIIAALLIFTNVPVDYSYDFVSKGAHKDVTSVIRSENSTVIVGDVTSYNVVDDMLYSVRARKADAIFVNSLSVSVAETIVEIGKKYDIGAVYCPYSSDCSGMEKLIKSEIEFYLFDSVPDDSYGIEAVFAEKFIGYIYTKEDISVLMLGYGVKTADVPVGIINRSAIIRVYTYSGKYDKRAYIVNYENKYSEEKPLSEQAIGGIVLHLNTQTGQGKKIIV